MATATKSKPKILPTFRPSTREELERAAAETEKDHRIRQLERTLGRKSLEIEILKNVVGE